MEVAIRSTFYIFSAFPLFCPKGHSWRCELKLREFPLLLRYIVRKDIHVKTDGVNQSNINGEKLVNYPFPFCTQEEQTVIVDLLDARLSEADQLDQTLTTALQQAEALRQSILKKAFSGQLVPQDPHDEPASKLLARIKAERESKSPSIPLLQRGKTNSAATSSHPPLKKGGRVDLDWVAAKSNKEP
ncbi:MAG: hypothetical protein WA140_11065 [Geobacteraceae bacterium]